MSTTNDPDHDPATQGPAERARSRLLVGVDGSDTSWRALYWAIGQARRSDLDVVAVNVLAVPATPTGGAGVAAAAALADGTEVLAGQVAAVATDSGIDIRYLSTIGDPAGALLRLAEEMHVDGVVIGASTALVHKLFGSLPVRAVKHSPCPVTVVP